MRMEDIQRIIDLAHERQTTEPIQRNPRHGARAKTKQDGAPAGNNTGGGGDGDKTCDHTLHSTNDRWFLEENDIHDRPGEQRHGRTDIRVQHRNTSIGTGGIRIPSIEAVPSRPEDPGSDQHEGDVARFCVYAIAVQARSDPPCAHKPSSPRRQVNDVSTRVINDAIFEQEAATPDTEGANGVGEGEPQGHEDHPCVEIHAAEEGAGDEDEGDCREDELEIHHRGLREGLREVGCGEVGIFEFEA